MSNRELKRESYGGITIVDPFPVALLACVMPQT